MTSDLQRMHQDEWLADLRIAEQQGYGSEALYKEPRCALGRALAICRPDYVPVELLDGSGFVFAQEWLGISSALNMQIWLHNDGGPNCGAMDFAEIADWFKAERDAHDGDLSNWRPS